MPTPEDRYLKSTFYEQLAEHVFISELLQEAWFRFNAVIDVSHSEIDASGYDLLLECNGIIRHVQLKTSDVTARASKQKVHISLAAKPSGCVVWILRNHDPRTNRLNLNYLFFGNEPGKPLVISGQFKVAKHTKADSRGIKKERQNLREVPKSRFQRVSDTNHLLRLLFGIA